MNFGYFVKNECWKQNELLSQNQFIKYLRDRGLLFTSLPSESKKLQKWEEKAWLFPILRTPQDIYFESNSLSEVLREKILWQPHNGSFITWLNKKEISSKVSFNSWYSPYSVIIVAAIIKQSLLELPKSILEKTPNEQLGVLQRYKSVYENEAKAFQNFEQRARKLIEVLIYVQNRYFPSVRGSILNMEIEEWQKYCRNFDPQKVLEVCPLSLDEIKEWQEYLAARGNLFYDPLKRWYLLTSYIPYKKRLELKGDALLAQDYYAMEEILRLFVRDISGEDLRKPDELQDPEWKIRFYGEDTIGKKYEMLEYLCNQYRINPKPRVILFVEGQGEYKALPQLFRHFGYSLEDIGIDIRLLGGVSEYSGRKKERGRRWKFFIEYHQEKQTIIYFILDNEGDAERTRVCLLEMPRSDHPLLKKVTKRKFHRIWKTSFELANFTNAELARALNKQAGGNYFSNKDIERLRRTQRRLKELYRERTGHDVDKVELDESLVDFLIKTSKRRKDASLRPIENEVLKIINLARSSHQPINPEHRDRNYETGFLG